MAYPGAFQIAVDVVFPDGDSSRKPTVTTSCDSNSAVASSFTAVEWSLTSNLPVSESDGLRITGVVFFRNGDRNQPYEPPFFVNGGTSFGDFNWVVTFNDEAVDVDTALPYDLDFQDDDFPGLAWDPTLTIQKRNSGAAAGG